MSSGRHAIAAYSTAFVGAAPALDALCTRRDAGERLLALHGAPGVGKSRIATEWARAYAARMGWRAALVDLSAAQTLQDSAIALARAVGVRLDNARPRDDSDLTRIVCAQLSELGPIVLVLDGVDHVSDRVLALVDATLAASDATVLLTGRAQLLDRDKSVEVKPLRVPAADATTEAVLRSPAVALFIDRARSIWRDYRPTGVELSGIASIVRTLDGLPLAIELASARLAVVTAAQLAPLVGPSIDLLVAADGSRDLRAVIAQSWATLTPAHQRLLSRLSICEGGFDFQLASGLSADEGGDRTAQHIACVDALHSLVRRSLVESTEDDGEGGGRRFRVLTPIRMFAAAHLDASGDRALAERDFVRAVLALPTPGLLGVDSLEEHRVLLRDERNFRRALVLAEAQHDDTAVLQLLVAMSVHYRLHGPLRWWLDADERVCGRFEHLSGELRQDHGIARAQCLIAAGRNDQARDALLWIESNARASRRPEALAWALSKLAVMAAVLGDHGLCSQYHRDARALLDECSEAVRLRIVRDEAWTLSRAGDSARSEALYREALALAQKLGATYQLPPLFGFVAHVEFDRGALSEAAALCAQAIEHAERIDDRRARYANAGALGLVLIEQGRLDDAREHLRVALDGHVRFGDRWHEAETRMYFGFLSLEAGAHGEAERWFREASSIHDDTMDGSAKAMADVGRALACDELGEVETARALRLGLEARVNEIDRAAVSAAIAVTRRAEDVVRARQLAADAAHAEAERIASELRAWLRGALAERPAVELRFTLRALLAIVERLVSRWQQGVRGARVIDVAFDGAWVRLDGETIELARASERRILLALASSAGASLPIDALFDAGWRGERASSDAKTNRVRVALTGLRRAGLRAVIERTTEGYRLSPDCAIALRGP